MGIPATLRSPHSARSELGALEPGYADITLLAADPVTCDPARLPHSRSWELSSAATSSSRRRAARSPASRDQGERCRGPAPEQAPRGGGVGRRLVDDTGGQGRRGPGRSAHAPARHRRETRPSTRRRM